MIASEGMAEHRVANGGVTARTWSDAQRAAIAEEFSRVISHPVFKSSKRCTELLGSLIKHALADNEEGMKERTLGMEVFGRSPDYDTNADPIVRRTANEIRKRLAQFYQETDVHHAVRIHLIRGAYLPDFEFEGDSRTSEATALAESEGLPDRSETHQPEIDRAKGLLRFRYQIWILGLTVALAAAGTSYFVLRSDTLRSPQYKVWTPLINSGEPINICLSNQPASASEGTKTGTQLANGSDEGEPTSPTSTLARFSTDTPFADAHVAEEISTRLTEFHGKAGLQQCSTLTFAQLRVRPVVLIGGTNNPWALTLLSSLRYSIRIDPVTRDKWIQDAQNPSSRDWKIDGKVQNTDASPDYAVISRFFYKDSGQWVVALSGLEAHGTEAAGQLVADPAFAKFIPSSIGSSGNFQIVLKTAVLNGSTGPFEVVAVHSW
jgi:hypothetical protein